MNDIYSNSGWAAGDGGYIYIYMLCAFFFFNVCHPVCNFLISNINYFGHIRFEVKISLRPREAEGGMKICGWL